MFKKYLLTGFVLLCFTGNVLAIDRAKIYSLFDSGSLAEINAAIDKLEVEKTSLSNAYRGTLMMKKAHLLKAPGQKLNAFKKGSKILENEIKNNGENAEFRFLRLIIQENAPRILNYNKEIDNDRAVILHAFQKLDQDLKSEIRNYSKKSKSVLTDQVN